MNIKIHLAALFFFVWSSLLATDYYISPNGSDENPGTIDRPWQTIGKANQELQAGDTVYLREGRYSQTIRPVNSGLPDATITISGYANEVAIIHSRPTGADLSGKSYIIIQRLHFENCNYFIRSIPDGFDFCIIKECIMRNQTGWCGIEIGDGCQHNQILNNVIDSGGVEGDCIHIGSDDFGEQVGAQYNLVANNECSGAMHGGICCAGDRTQFNLIRQNYVHDIGDNGIATGAGVRWTLIEGNRIFNPGIDSDGASAMQIRSENCIIRHNIMYRDFDLDIENGAAALLLQSTDELPDVRNNKIFHNTIYRFDQQRTHWHGIQLSVLNTEIPFGPNIFKNNIIYKNGVGNENGFQIAYTRAVTTPPLDIFAGNLICRQQSNEPVIYLFEFDRRRLTLTDAIQQYPNNFRASNIDAPPLFIDEAMFDFRLQQNSPGIDAGVFLTRTIGDGQGNQVTVEDAAYFCDGWGVIEGDTIRVGSNHAVKILEIDYPNNRLTVERSISWQAGDPVSLNYAGKAPDIGAFEMNGSRDRLAPLPPQNVKVMSP
ncbi:MAG: right-handed parallel beta-helix repeat-containing protein [candidate division KSB1 bacterium]|nr:right-handed parallel beta-helix repeat-containing protein [candidate division KSB1 bacterium]MDZ7317693.1 right-handed parallel beta-helix repeat-containing protein [candidate division KSB1 bacterium]MDZ7340156.1 right-handed parallel beta-helix repeat-containing protein [candidate division KSB1 bacterium]